MKYRKVKGQSLVETSLLLSLVSVVAISSLSFLGEQVRENLRVVNIKINTALQSSAISGNIEAILPTGPQTPVQIEPEY